MPTQVLQGLLVDWKPSFELVELLANKFATTLTATAYRCVEVTAHACALVWSEDGATKWFKRSSEFSHWVRLRERLDQRTFAADCFQAKGVPEVPESVPAAAWLDGRVREDARVLEQTRCMPSYSGALTLLWLPNPDALAHRADGETLAELDPAEFGLRRKNWPSKK